MVKNISFVTGLMFFCLLSSCDLDFNKLFKKDTKPGKKENTVTKTPVVNPYASIFSGLNPRDRNAGLLLGLNTLSGYRTLYITYQDGKAEVKTDVPYIIYPYHNSLLYITRLAKDSIFGNIYSGWLPKKTVHYWEEIHILKNKKNMDSLYRNWNPHKRQPFYILTKENSLTFDSQKVNIDYLINFHLGLSFEGTDNKNRRKVFSSATGIYVVDTNINYISLKPNDAGFLNESGKERLLFSGLHQLFSPPIVKELKSKINKELYKKSINNEFADTILPKEYLDKLKADTTEVFFTLKREKGIVKLIACAYALTDNPKISQTYKLKVEYDCGKLQQPYISHNILPVNFDDIQTQFGESKILDVLVSPFHNILLILNERSLKGIDVRTGKKILSYNLPVNSRIIMAEWADTDHFYRLEQLLYP